MKTKKAEVSINYHILKDSVVVNFSGKTFPFKKSDKMYKKVIKKIKDGKMQDIPEMVDIQEKIRKIDPKKIFHVEDGAVFCYGKEAEPYLAQRLIELSEEGLPVEPLALFWTKAYENPSKDARKDLFRFVEHNQFPITPTGNIIAYKAVRDDFMDKYTGKIDNSPGKEVKMDRDAVTANREVTCAAGLHAAGFDYAKFSYGGGSDIMIDIEIDPRDVVSVPRDYNSSKCRVCRYVVIGVSGGEIQDNVISTKEVKEKKAKVDNRETKKDDTVVGEGAGTLKIGRNEFNVSVVKQVKFDATLKADKFKKICRYDQPKHFKNQESELVYRRKQGDNFIYLIKEKDGSLLYMEQVETK